MSHLKRPNPIMTRDKYVKLTSNSRFKPGTWCWARRDTQRIWPAVITDPSDADLQSYPFVNHHVSIFVHFLVVDYHAFVPETEIWDYLTGVDLFSRTKAAKTDGLEQAINNLKRFSDLPSDMASGSNSKQPLKESIELQEKDETDEIVDIYEFNEEDDFYEKGDEINPGHQRFSQIGRKTNSTVQEIQVDQLCLLEPKVVLQRKNFLENTITTSFKSNEVECGAKVGDDRTEQNLDKAVNENESADPKKVLVEKVKKTKNKRQTKEISVPKDENIVKKMRNEKGCDETEERAGIKKSHLGRVTNKQESFQEVPNSEREPQACAVNESNKVEECAQGKDTQVKIGEGNSVTVLPPDEIFFSFREATFDKMKNARHSPHVTLRNMPQNVMDKFRAVRLERTVSDLKIGFIGMGSLGKRLAHRLLITGHKVFLWNRSPWKCYNFINHASSLMKRSPEELANECDIIFMCVTDKSAVKSIFHKYPGFLHSLKGKGIVNLTTMDLKSHAHVKEVIESCGGTYLHVSLSQSETNGDANNYLSIVSGNKSLLGDALTCLGSFSNGIFYLDSHDYAANVGVYMKVFNASFNILCNGVNALVKDQVVLPSHLRKVYNTHHLFTDASSFSKREILSDNPLSNHLPPKVVSQSLANLVVQMKEIDSVPMLGVLDEMFNVKSER